MLQLFNFIKCSRLPYQLAPQIYNCNFRYLSDKTKKPCQSMQVTTPACKNKDNTNAKKDESKKKEECKKKETPPVTKTECKKPAPEAKKTECKQKETPAVKKTECKKVAPEAKKNDETEIRGGAKCKSKKKKDASPGEKKGPKQKSCEELILEREGLSKPKKGCQKQSKGSSGGTKRPSNPCQPKPSYEHSKKWSKITFMGVLPIVAILTILVFATHKEGERPPFKHYPHMYLRTKPFCWGDGNRGGFHNGHWNALPPDGYEDEIDQESVGKTPESDEERETRLKEFSDVQTEWKKLNDKREADAKKAAAEAEKEAKKAAAAAEKEAKKQQDLEAKEEKKRQAEADKEAKKQQAQADKEEKKLRAELEKERKRQEAEDKKKAKETQNYESAFLNTESEE